MSAETLNFGPEWLRALSGETQATSPPISTQTFPVKTTSTKFKLAQYRYGREEMLALFTKDSDTPEELLQVPSIVAEEALLPLSLIPMTEEEQRQSTYVNSSATYRGRGGSGAGRGRSAPPRGRGRGRGDGYVRAVSHDDENLYGTRWDHNRHDGWDSRKGTSSSRDGFEEVRRPRRVNSEDWRNDGTRGRGDGAEESFGGKEWKVSGSRRDAWRDTWRNRESDSKDKRSRASSTKDSFSAVPEWAENVNPEVGQFDSHGTFRARKISSSETDTNWRRNDKEDSKSDTDSKPENNSTEQSNNIESNYESQKTTHGLNEEDPDWSDSAITEKDNEGAVKPSTSEEQHGTENKAEIKDAKNKLYEVKKIQTEDHSDDSTPVFQQPVTTEQETLSQLEMTSMSVMNSLSDVVTNTSTESDVAAAKPTQDTSKLWLYKDPQGDTQGPFKPSEMMEWFSAGYFTMNLQVRRCSDAKFTPLGELINSLGYIPFIPKQPSPVQRQFQPSPEPHSQSLLQQQQQQMLLQQRLLQQQENKNRSFQQQALYQTVIGHLHKREDFRILPIQEQHQVALRYMAQLQEQEKAQNPQTINTMSSSSSKDLHMLLEKLHRSAMATNLEAKKREEEEIRRKVKEQEEKKKQEELQILLLHEQQVKELRRRDEELRKHQEDLARREEEIRIQQEKLEAQRLLQKRMEEEELRKQKELDERRRQVEEEARKKKQQMLEQMRIEAQRKAMEAAKLAAIEEEKRQEEQKRKEEEQRMEMLRREEERRREELKRIELERQREEEKLKQQKLLREQEKLREQKRLKEEELKRLEILQQQQLAKEQEALKQKELLKQKEAKAKAKELEMQRQWEIKQQKQVEQMQNIKLPSHAMWGQQQQRSVDDKKPLSLVEIQQLEKKKEADRRRQEEQMRALKISSQPAAAKTGWAGKVAASQKPKTMLQIQQEEQRKQNSTRKTNTVNNLSTTPDAKWSRQVSSGSSQWSAPQNSSQAMFWDQVVEENKPMQKKNNNQNRGNKSKQTKSNSGKTKPPAATLPPVKKNNPQTDFNEWCENYLKRINIGDGIDIPTFIGFLQEVESAMEVRDYVCSYMGETKDANDFAKEFVNKRRMLKANKTDCTVTITKKELFDTDGFEVVQSSTKKGRKKQRKQQRVDPSILGFSVNAASDRVNMGEIQSANDI